MKKLLILLIALLLPACALADAPVVLEGSTPLSLPGEDPCIADCIPLPDGGALLNVLTTGTLDGASMDMLYLIRIDSTGNSLWETRYHAFSNGDDIDRYTLTLDQGSVTVTHYADLIGNDTCTRTNMLFDLASGKQKGALDICTIPTADVPTLTHCGDYRIEEFFGEQNEFTLRTRITHVPTGATAEYNLYHDLTWAAFGDKLLCFNVGSEDRGSYWMYDQSCQPVLEDIHTPFGDGHRMITHAAELDGWLYLFVWLDGDDPDERTYAVYPMDGERLFGDSIALFTLAEGHSLADVEVCGEGFLLTEYHSWEWQQPLKNTLSYLSLDGVLTVLAPELTFPRNDSAHLLPGPDDAHACVIHRDDAGTGYCLQTYAIQ